MNYVLFICGHNAGRSQMSQAFFNLEKKNYPKIDKAYQAISAGTRPGDEINPTVIQAMQEVGIDMFDTNVYFPKPLNDFSVVSVGNNLKRAIIACDDSCILPSGLPQIPLEKWNLPDPNKQPIENVRKVREAVKTKVVGLLEELNNRTN